MEWVHHFDCTCCHVVLCLCIILHAVYWWSCQNGPIHSQCTAHSAWMHRHIMLLCILYCPTLCTASQICGSSVSVTAVISLLCTKHTWLQVCQMPLHGLSLPTTNHDARKYFPFWTDASLIRWYPISFRLSAPRWSLPTLLVILVYNVASRYRLINILLRSWKCHMRRCSSSYKKMFLHA